MSYDFIMMRPKTEIRSSADLGEETLLKQDPADLVAALSALFPDLTWSRERDGGWSSLLEGEDTWYEFSIYPMPDYCWWIRTSHLTNTRKLVPRICETLGLIAFDGQAGIIIGTDGQPRPAGGQS